MSPNRAPLEFAGENPCIVLYDDRGQVTVGASYWGAGASIAGMGQALFLFDHRGETPVSRVLTDSTQLVAFLATFNRHFVGFEGGDWSVEPEIARFSFDRGESSAVLKCEMASVDVKLEWHQLGLPYLLRSHAKDFGGEIGRCYEVSSVIRPARAASIQIAGEQAPGTLLTPYGNLPISAFLAFCETWSREGAKRD